MEALQAGIRACAVVFRLWLPTAQHPRPPLPRPVVQARRAQAAVVAVVPGTYWLSHVLRRGYGY